jgi:hypothetical protein
VTTVSKESNVPFLSKARAADFYRQPFTGSSLNPAVVWVDGRSGWS